MNDFRVEVSDEAGVRTLTLRRPEKKNAFDVLQAEQLWAAIEGAASDESVKVLVVTGEGDYFSAGADTGIFMSLGDYTPDQLQRVARLYQPLRACTKPTIAMVQGHCVGMGVTILPSFDLVYAADHVTFRTPFVRLGLVLEYGSSHTLSRLIGAQRAKEMILRAAPIDAATAHAWGLVTRAFPSATLRDETMKIARDIADNPPTAVRESKRLIDAGISSTFDGAASAEEEALSSRYGSEENIAAVMALMSRKK